MRKDEIEEKLHRSLLQGNSKKYLITRKAIRGQFRIKNNTRSNDFQGTDDFQSNKRKNMKV